MKCGGHTTGVRSSLSSMLVDFLPSCSRQKATLFTTLKVQANNPILSTTETS